MMAHVELKSVCM